MRRFALLSGAVAALSLVPSSTAGQATPAEGAIESVILALMAGIDQQDGSAINHAFDPQASLVATNPSGSDVVRVTAEEFAQLHAAGRFGGQERAVSISTIDVTDDLVANAKVIAENDRVHYTYYLGFAKTNGRWVIHSMLQRSRPA